MLISRTLFTRPQTDAARCREGQGLPGDSVAADCDYKKVPFWIQFMTHDCFSHLEDGQTAESARMLLPGSKTGAGEAQG